MDLGPHAPFIVSAYAATAVILGALALWIWFDYRTQQRALADFEARGVTRRSERVHQGAA